MGPYSAYEYLTFVMPGATVLFVAIYGWFGWPWKEPGGTLLVGILAACFLVGNALSAIATWLEPTLLGRRPGSAPDGLWGQFGRRDRHHGDQNTYQDLFRERYGSEIDMRRGYSLARTEVSRSVEGAGLERLNQQIGFYRGMTVACLVAFVLEGTLAAAWHSRLDPAIWMPTLAGGTVLFGYRFRRFWRWYGDYVLRVIRLLPAAEGPDQDRRGAS